jgi:gamma-glutamylcyclotransferase (GGCT)/AIG2-like uncharacterized protein YtfP
MSKFLFTYGALTNAFVMADRCPTAELVGNGIADLHGYKLVFRYHSDIQPFEGGVVRGVVWCIGNCESALDQFESDRYIKREVSILHEQHRQQMDAIAYVMRGRAQQEVPSARYRDIVVTGYREHRIPVVGINLGLREAERFSNRQIFEIRKNELDYSDSNEQT